MSKKRLYYTLVSCKYFVW